MSTGNLHSTRPCVNCHIGISSEGRRLCVCYVIYTLTVFFWMNCCFCVTCSVGVGSGKRVQTVRLPEYTQTETHVYLYEFILSDSFYLCPCVCAFLQIGNMLELGDIIRKASWEKSHSIPNHEIKSTRCEHICEFTSQQTVIYFVCLFLQAYQ